MSVIKPKAQQTQGVGNDIGSRRKFLEHQGANTVPAKPVQHQSLDNFLGSSSKKPNDLSAFAPDATFKSARGRFSGAGGVPYRRPLPNHIENGTAPVNSGASRPSNEALIRYLDRVIATAPVSGAARAARPSGTPVAPTKAVVSKAVPTK